MVCLICPLVNELTQLSQAILDITSSDRRHPCCGAFQGLRGQSRPDFLGRWAVCRGGPVR